MNGVIGKGSNWMKAVLRQKKPHPLFISNTQFFQYAITPCGFWQQTTPFQGETRAGPSGPGYLLVSPVNGYMIMRSINLFIAY